MKALVHIGPPKSGTTSIQAFLRFNRLKLSDNHVATLPNREWIRTLSAMFREETPAATWYAASGQASKQSFEQFKEHAAKKLRNEIKRLPSTTKLLVLSSEGLFSCHEGEMRALQQFLSEYCEQIEIITYLRRQDLMTNSKQKNKIRNKSRTVPITDRYQRKNDFWRQLQKWASVFGQEQINVRRFPDSAPEKFDLLEQFQSELAARVGDWPGDFEIPAYRNVGWNWQANEYMRIANEVCRQQLSDSNFHQRLVRQIDRQFSGGEKPSIHRPLAMAIVAIYRESNEKVCKKYFPGEDELFHDDFSGYPETERELNQQLSVEMAVQMSTELMAGLLADRSDRRDRRRRVLRAGPLQTWISRSGRIVNRVRQLCGI